MASHQSVKLALLLCLTLIALNFCDISVHALNIGELAQFGLSLASGGCSTKCESQNCNVAPMIRYGKYCGIGYSGCPGEKPCDGIDHCCMDHDACIKAKNNDYLNAECSQNFINCLDRVKRARRKRTFSGNTCSMDQVANIMTKVMNIGVGVGKIIKS